MNGRTSSGRRRTLTAAAAVALAGALAATIPSGPSSGTAGAQTAAATVSDPAALVHPLDGTGTGPVSPGTVGEFPGADTPFGLIQWSPDTSPNAVQSGGGYAYSDSSISGFS
ncbi:MAG: glycoside hydrolase family 92 protein, partial [Acidimicrobiales bacterium]